MGLQITKLKAGYGSKVVLEDCSLSVKGSETMVLMGPSGCGKSTLLLSLVGVLAPLSGKILLNGKNLNGVPIEMRNIGYLPQDYGLFPHLDVQGNIEYGLMVRGVQRAERQKTALEMLELVNLHGMAHRRIKELSGGQRQRVGLARALAIKPDLILLDEPLSSVDQLTKSEVARKLREVFGRIKIPKIVVTHTPYDAFVLADKLAVMIEGKIVQKGMPARVFAKPKNEMIRKLVQQLDMKGIAKR